MKTLYNITVIFTIIVLILLCLFLWFRYDNKQPEIIEITDTVKTTIYKDSIKYVSKKKIKEIPKVDFVYLRDTIFVTDTIWLINDYFATYFYSDTLKNDSSAKIVINDSISMNRIINRVAFVDVYNKTKIIQSQPVYLTLGTFYIQNSKTNSIGLKVGLNTLKNQFSVGYGINNTYLFTYDYKFRIK